MARWKTGQWVVAAAVWAVAGIGFAQQGTAGGGGPGGAGFVTPTALTELNNAVHDLYRQANSSLVRLEIKQTAASVLTPALKAEFDTWLKENSSAGGPPGGPGGGGGRNPGRTSGGGGTAAGSGNGEGRGSGRGRGENPGQGGGVGFGRGGLGGGAGPGGSGANAANQVRTFLEQKATKSTPADAASLRGLALRIELNRNGYQGDLSAILLDADGHALVPAGLLREAHNDPIKITLPDGSTASAKFIGANLLGGFSIVQLDNMKGLRPAPLARAGTTAGDLLLAISAGDGSATLIVANNKLSVSADDRSGAFFFDLHGNLAALAAGGGNGPVRMNSNRLTIGFSRLQREVDYIVKNNRDIEQRSLGVAFQALSKDPQRAGQVASLLKGGSGVIVTNIEAKSLADKAGLKKDDVITSIDGRPLSDFVSPDGRSLQELVQLQFDLTTRTGKVPLGVIRREDGADKEETLEIPLD